IAKADEIAAKMNVPEFASNTGWLSRFKGRHGIVVKTASGD
ncbi:hypothetical protein LSAT2_006551, partial [Lamellibrachia satsuma]